MHGYESLQQEAEPLKQQLQDEQGETGKAVPGPGFWAMPDDELQQAAPWDAGAFRAARDDVFVAALRLHRAVIVAAARTIKSSLNTVARMAQGGSGAVKPSAVDWGIFFLLVPVVSTTFASVGRMFQGMGAGEIGWLFDRRGGAGGTAGGHGRSLAREARRDHW
ncbi:hypothetical protein [Teichococcus vastitatis]|uniref:ESX-1 secretion-associated protein EspA/EspE-like domain-containing protein n=1 Tax=Teichococcus vastitatis TaxID=2307076 RepID=A0ABS9W6A8_9PROT|nr:hypothetical protein [Pseudoroseomonas vastitatis]MCI0754833.1 hypothetical protein [Pseudoroseomonas vastitatis]